MESVSGIRTSEAERLPCLPCEGPASPAPPVVAMPGDRGQPPAGGGAAPDDTPVAAAAAGDAATVAVEAAAAPSRVRKVSVEIAPDALTARVGLEPGDDGTQVALEELLEALAAAGVVHGLDHGAMHEACQAPGPQSFVAATATPPRAGEDAQFELLVVDHCDRAPRLDEMGLIDFREHGAVPMVDVDQPLMRRTPAAAGVDGSDVLGRPLPAQPGNDQPFHTPFSGVALDPLDPNLLRAACKGQPVRTGTAAVLVEAVCHVKAVNMASGNITFDGTVDVEGDVMAGMKVRASGDIRIGGTVEGGELDAGGDIRVAGGVIANAKLQAGSSVSARFVEKSELRAGGAIVVDNMVLHSRLQAGAQIAVGVKAHQRGRLAGGLAQARTSVSAPLLGLAGGERTQVEVGVDLALDERHAALLVRLDAEKSEEEKLDKLVQHLTRLGDPKGLLPRAREARQNALKNWAASLNEKQEVAAQLAAMREAKVEVGVGTEGEIELAFGRKRCRLKAGSGAGVFLVQDDGAIAHRNAQGQLSVLP